MSFQINKLNLGSELGNLTFLKVFYKRLKWLFKFFLKSNLSFFQVNKSLDLKALAKGIKSSIPSSPHFMGSFTTDL